jgi:CheY-like chemotaxis protein
MAIRGDFPKTLANVLIVDDDAIVCEDIKSILQTHRYQVSGIAVSGRDAIQLAQENPPDLILMDVKLQGDLNGIEAAIVIQGSSDQSIPVVFLTAFNLSDFPYLQVVHQCTYLNKPFTEKELIDCIETAPNNPQSLS